MTYVEFAPPWTSQLSITSTFSFAVWYHFIVAQLFQNSTESLKIWFIHQLMGNNYLFYGLSYRSIFFIFQRALTAVNYESREQAEQTQLAASSRRKCCYLMYCSEQWADFSPAFFFLFHPCCIYRVQFQILCIRKKISTGRVAYELLPMSMQAKNVPLFSASSNLYDIKEHEHAFAVLYRIGNCQKKCPSLVYNSGLSKTKMTVATTTNRPRQGFLIFGTLEQKYSWEL